VSEKGIDDGRIVCWLIEMKSSERSIGYWWFCGGRTEDIPRFTRDPSAAVRYPTKAAAEAAMFHEDLPRDGFVTIEHVFFSGPPANGRYRDE
jgi:hypothetical protein